jgi:hypothetical protein
MAMRGTWGIMGARGAIELPTLGFSIYVRVKQTQLIWNSAVAINLPK